MALMQRKVKLVKEEVCKGNDCAEAVLGVLGTKEHGYFEMGNRETMTKCRWEQESIVSIEVSI